ncbi:hypothetical protein L249_4741 [Ophiocordyceps polyrhachis-furcata BCC 54312]|uniref:Inositol polyphosphate-related phosphatase domain-containing protein n=1 Tax=Ophiocordyceps polyrhachis-furcata BCC 54312 TaxID=1330021 RepID=A0A367L2S5_9HYPO|nr:hypothetical protein L249_4741 [Ophiocordyceps polyrhachis-furcata BCC 54312]
MATCDARVSSLSPGGGGDMQTSATVDLLVLTFNCAKHLIHPGVFARHLRWAMRRNSGGVLPEVVVLSLQEVAPLSKAFVGEYFLRGYLERFEEAVNGAAMTMTPKRKKTKTKTKTKETEMETETETETTSTASTTTTTTKTTTENTPYTLVKARNVGYTAMMLFARHPARLSAVREAEVGFGAADMGNKGAVGMRTLYSDDDGRTTELTFVATHLAAMEWNLPRRNANWAAIMRGLTFENPEGVLAMEGLGAEEMEGEDDEDEGARLLNGNEVDRDEDRQHDRLRRRLHDLSVYKPSSHLFVAGDLNYRIAPTPPPPGASLPSLDPRSQHYFGTFLPLDQLTRERIAGRTLHGLVEAPVTFPPTYKYLSKGCRDGDGDGGFYDESQHYEDDDDDDDDDTDNDKDLVRWRFASHRWPAWTDRILYLDMPSWLEGRQQMHVRAYDALPVLRTSDHRAVFLRVDVPLVAPADLAARPSSSSSSLDAADPRIRLPVEIDPEAWARRRAARQKERFLGWTMLLWSSPEGAWLLLASLVVAAGGAYWFYYAGV